MSGNLTIAKSAFVVLVIASLINVAGFIWALQYRSNSAKDAVADALAVDFFNGASTRASEKDLQNNLSQLFPNSEKAKVEFAAHQIKVGLDLDRVLVESRLKMLQAGYEYKKTRAERLDRAVLCLGVTCLINCLGIVLVLRTMSAVPETAHAAQAAGPNEGPL